jgi:hypothetical protein
MTGRVDRPRNFDLALVPLVPSENTPLDAATLHLFGHSSGPGRHFLSLTRLKRAVSHPSHLLSGASGALRPDGPHHMHRLHRLREGLKRTKQDSRWAAAGFS